MNKVEQSTGQAHKGTLVRSGRPVGRTPAPVKMRQYVKQYGPGWADALTAAALSGDTTAIGFCCLIATIQDQQGKS